MSIAPSHPAGDRNDPATTDAAADAQRDGHSAGAECLEAALAGLAREWSTLAVCPPNHVGVGKTHAHKCKSPGKAPWGPWKTYQAERATEAELRAKWQSNPQLNVGLALGPVSGLVGVDVDGEGGEARLLELSKGDLPATLEFTSGNGRRLLYAIPPGVTLRITHEPGGENHNGISLLGEGAQTVIPPSRHKKSGRRYAWVLGRGPGEIEPAVAPPWVIGLMVRGLGDLRGTSKGQDCPKGDGQRFPEQHRNKALTRLAGVMRRYGMSAAEMQAALLVVNRDRCIPPLEEVEVATVAQSVARYAPHSRAVRLLIRDGQLSRTGRGDRRRGHTTLSFSFTVEVE